jgi:hypothetical protein
MTDDRSALAGQVMDALREIEILIASLGGDAGS